MVETETSWYVAYTKPRLELTAQEQLLRQAYHVQLPLVRKLVRRKPTLEPLFPRYIFFQPSKEGQSISPVRSTVGVSTIVRFGMDLAVLSSLQCQRIMEFAQAQQNGGLDAMLEVQGIRVGQKVYVQSGPFAGLEGLVSGMGKERVLVLMRLLGKEQTLKFQAEDLTAA
jgi:transcriptional antiterminator RfaH